MMLSFPEYLGLSLDASSLILKRWFDYLSLALSLPVLLYCASEFFESSYKAVKNRTLNIDLPITLAVVATFVRSLYEVFFLHESGYFDSMTGIVFLLLLGRYFQDLTYNSLSFDRDYKSYFPLATRKFFENEVRTVAINTLAKDDRIELRNSELLPADAILESGIVSIDYSFITGESNPVALKEGEKVYAGAIVNGRSSVFRLLDSTDNSRLVKLWSVEKNKSGKDVSLTEKINFYFTLGLLIVGTFAFIYQLQVNGMTEAIKSLTSVLIVACPCILLLATTFANGHLLRTLKNHGMFVRNKSTITALSACDTFVFDKTGTLTDNKAYSVSDLTDLNPEELEKVAFICYQSVHPYSVAIAAHFYKHGKFKISAYTDSAGNGLTGRIDGDLIRIGSGSFIGKNELDKQGQSAVHIEYNGSYKGCFVLRHSIRSEANALIKALEKDDYDLYVSSGDREINTELDQQPFIEVFKQQEPEDKVNLIKKLKDRGKVVCMAGDGLNDAPAMKEADIAISVADSENAFFPACDVLLSSISLKRLPALMRMIKASKWVLIFAFVFSLIYNAIGLYYAVTASLSPLTAAILMPSSSVSMLLITWGLNSLLSRIILSGSMD